jgi:hypothetical protein
MLYQGRVYVYNVCLLGLKTSGCPIELNTSRDEVCRKIYRGKKLLSQVIRVLRLKVDGDDQRCQEPRVCKISSGVGQPSRFTSLQCMSSCCAACALDLELVVDACNCKVPAVRHWSCSGQELIVSRHILESVCNNEKQAIRTISRQTIVPN